MRADILQFLRTAKKRYGIEVSYIPTEDLYIVTKNGKAVQNFTSYHFYQVPKHFRLREWGAIINVGLNHNMGEKSVVNQLEQVKTMGKKIKL